MLELRFSLTVPRLLLLSNGPERYRGATMEGCVLNDPRESGDSTLLMDSVVTLGRA